MMNATMKNNYPEWDDNKKLSMSLFAMIPLGAGEVLGGFMVGFVIDRWRQKAGIFFCMILFAIAYTIVFV